MWKFKTDRKGNTAPAVQRRVALLGKKGAVDLNSQKSRADGRDTFVDNMVRMGYEFDVLEDILDDES